MDTNQVRKQCSNEGKKLADGGTAALNVLVFLFALCSNIVVSFCMVFSFRF